MKLSWVHYVTRESKQHLSEFRLVSHAFKPLITRRIAQSNGSVKTFMNDMERIMAVEKFASSFEEIRKITLGLRIPWRITTRSRLKVSMLMCQGKNVFSNRTEARISFLMPRNGERAMYEESHEIDVC